MKLILRLAMVTVLLLTGGALALPAETVRADIPQCSAGANYPSYSGGVVSVNGWGSCQWVPLQGYKIRVAIERRTSTGSVWSLRRYVEVYFYDTYDAEYVSTLGCVNSTTTYVYRTKTTVTDMASGSTDVAYNGGLALQKSC